MSVPPVNVSDVSMTDPMDLRDRQALGALRYAVNEEAGSYLAIMALFTTGMSGFLSDQSAAEVAERLAEQGVELDQDMVEARLSYLVEHGNLARSPRETEARSVREYLANRSRYQLTQRGELVHRQIEELLAHTDTAREVSSEMLPGILTGLQDLARLAASGLARAEPRDVAARIGTVFAQFELLVSSTRQFYTYLSQVLTRFDLGRDEFEIFKGALLDYLQRFVDEISRHMPQLADVLSHLAPEVPRLCDRANAGERLVGVDGTRARRATGLDPDDWASLQTWFTGAAGRRADADNVRRLATDALRALLVNLRRIAAGADRRQSRYTDLVALAGWFDRATDDRAHELWAAAFGLYPSRHLSFLADDDADPVPPTQSWWRGPVATVPVHLRTRGERQAGGRSGARADYSAAKRARLADRQRIEARRAAAIRELAGVAGHLTDLRLSDDGRTALLELYSQALTRYGRPLAEGATATADTPLDDARLRVQVTREPGGSVKVISPQGRLVLVDIGVCLTLDVADAQEFRTAAIS